MATIASLIVNIAADTSDLRRNVEQISGTVGKLEGVAMKAGKMLAGAFTIAAIGKAVKDTLDYADALTNLSARTGISTTGLQKLNLAFEQSGVALETVTRASSELATRLVKGDKSAVAALEKMGLSVEALKRMKPEDQFLAAADAVGQIQNKGEQLYASKTLFGKSGVEMLSGLTGHLKETTAEFERMGLIMDEETVRAADEFGDKLGLMGKQLLALVATIIGPFLPAISATLDVLMKIGQLIGKVVGPAFDWLVRITLAASIAINRFVATILEAVTRVPILGKHLGIAGDAAKWLREQAAQGDVQLAKMFTSTEALGSAAAQATPPLLGLGEANVKGADAAKKHADEIKRLVATLSGAELIESVENQIEAIEKVGGIGALTRDELEQFAGAVSKAVEKMLLMGQVVPASWLAIANTIRANPLLSATQDALGDSLKGGINRQQLVLRNMAETPTRAGGDLQFVQNNVQALMTAVPAAVQNQNASAAVYAAAQTLGAKFKAGWQTSVSALPQTILAAFQGGGSVGQSVGALLGGNLTQGLATKLGSTLSGMFGKTLGSALGSVIPGIGSLLGGMIGPLIGKLAKKIWSGIQGLFGNDEEARMVNPARDNWFLKYGTSGTGAGSGFMNVAAQLTEITGEEGGGSLFRALTQADTMAEFTAATAAIERKLAEVHDRNTEGFESVSDAADGLNLTVQGSDDAIAALGQTQDRVVNTMLSGFDKLIAKLDDFVARLGAATSASMAMGDAADRAAASAPSGAGGSVASIAPAQDSYQDFSSGGYDGFDVYHRGGMVWPKAHGGLNLAPDEVPIIAQTGERVLNRVETAAYNRNEGSSGTVINIAPGAFVANGMTDPRAFARASAKYVVEEIKRFNAGGTRNKMRPATGEA